MTDLTSLICALDRLSIEIDAMLSSTNLLNDGGNALYTEKSSPFLYLSNTFLKVTKSSLDAFTGKDSLSSSSDISKFLISSSLIFNKLSNPEVSRSILVSGSISVGTGFFSPVIGST